MTQSKSEYDSLIQNMHSIFTSDISTLAHLGISYLASSSPSSLIDYGASTHMTSKFTVFTTFHTSFAAFIVFIDDSSKCITDTDIVTSLSLIDVNHVFLLISYP